MAKVKLNQPTLISETGEVVTIAALLDAGRASLEVIENVHAPRARDGVRTLYFANLLDEHGEETGTGWEIGKAAYLSRTGQDVASEIVGA